MGGMPIRESVTGPPVVCPDRGDPSPEFLGPGLVFCRTAVLMEVTVQLADNYHT